MCHGSKLTIGDYTLSTRMYSIYIVVVDEELGVQLLETLGEFSMNLKEIYLKWKEGGKENSIKDMKSPPP